MADITMEQIKRLRERTGLGIMDCKQALIEAGGDEEKAIEILRKKGLATAAKKATRATKEGFIGSYIHSNGKIGVLVEINTETDFVARNAEFREFAKNIAMHIAASFPLYVSPESIPEEVLEKEKEIYREQLKDSGKPEHVIEKIIEGKLKKFYQEVCLLEQPYVKNPDITVKQYLTEQIAKFGENIVIRRFVRLAVGEEP